MPEKPQGLLLIVFDRSSMILENPGGDFCMVAHSFLHDFLIGLGAAQANLDVSLDVEGLSHTQRSACT